jgi:hypothetical protein
MCCLRMHQRLSLQLLPLVLTILEDLRSASETAQRTLFAAFQVNLKKKKNIIELAAGRFHVCISFVLGALLSIACLHSLRQ